jgi:hypothetical protein
MFLSSLPPYLPPSFHLSNLCVPFLLCRVLLREEGGMGQLFVRRLLNVAKGPSQEKPDSFSHSELRAVDSMLQDWFAEQMQEVAIIHTTLSSRKIVHYS